MSSLTTAMLANLKAELINDPSGRGYASAGSDAEKAALFNAPFSVSVAVPQPARITQVLTEPFAPNVVVASDITAALAS